MRPRAASDREIFPGPATPASTASYARRLGRKENKLPLLIAAAILTGVIQGPTDAAIWKREDESATMP